VNNVCTLNEYLALLGGSSDNLALYALRVTGEYYNGIALFDVKISH
jgi:hypothetical protein